jgi:hypothetical protein
MSGAAIAIHERLQFRMQATSVQQVDDCEIAKQPEPDDRDKNGALIVND